jgi:hypothetical protein
MMIAFKLHVSQCLRLVLPRHSCCRALQSQPVRLKIRWEENRVRVRDPLRLLTSGDLMDP